MKYPLPACLTRLPILYPDSGTKAYKSKYKTEIQPALNSEIYFIT
jgi:hypothetical protein